MRRKLGEKRVRGGLYTRGRRQLTLVPGCQAAAEQTPANAFDDDGVKVPLQEILGHSAASIKTGKSLARM